MIHHVTNLSLQDGEPMKMGGGGDTLSTATGGQVQQENEAELEVDTPVYEKHDHLLHGKTPGQKFVSRIFLKKYIHVARALKPVLTREACDIISTEYTKLRAQETVSADKAKVSLIFVLTTHTHTHTTLAHSHTLSHTPHTHTDTASDSQNS